MPNHKVEQENIYVPVKIKYVSVLVTFFIAVIKYLTKAM